MRKAIRLILDDLHVTYSQPRSFRKIVHTLLFNPGWKAIAHYRLAHHLWNKNRRFLAHWLTYRARNKYGIEISALAKIGERFHISHGVGIVIGGGVSIGDDCSVFQGVTIGTRDSVHGRNEYPVIGNRTVVYAGAKVIGGVHLGDETIVGANAVVLDDAPARSFVVGIPGKARPQKKKEESCSALNSAPEQSPE